jgi:hypothetical protein
VQDAPAYAEGVPAVLITRPVARAPRFFSAERVASAAPVQYCAPTGAPPEALLEVPHVKAPEAKLRCWPPLSAHVGTVMLIVPAVVMGPPARGAVVAMLVTVPVASPEGRSPIVIARKVGRASAPDGGPA